MKHVNKHNIEISMLKSLKVNKKDYDKVHAIKFDNKLNINVAMYKSVITKNTFKHTIKSFATRKQYKSSSYPNLKMSSIYSEYQSNYRTTDVDRFISEFRHEDKLLNVA